MGHVRRMVLWRVPVRPKARRLILYIQCGQDVEHVSDYNSLRGPDRLPQACSARCPEASQGDAAIPT